MKAAPRLPTLLSRLLRHVLVPLIWAGVLGALAMSMVARHFTSEAYDRALLDDALMMTGHVSETRGMLDFRLSPAEMKAVLFDQSENVFFAIYATDGHFVAGHAGLPALLPQGGARHAFDDVVFQGQHLRTVTVLRDKPMPFTVVMAQTTRSRDRVLQQVLVFSLLPQLALLAILALWLRRNIATELQPLSDLEQDLSQRDASDLSSVRVHRGSSDMQRLGEEVNGLLGRIALGLQAQREFSGNVAHELRTPLAGIRAQAEYGLGSAEPRVWREQLQGVLQSQERASHLVDQLLALALVSEARQLLTLEPVCLSELATQTVLRWMPQADQRGVDLGGHGLDVPCWVWGQRALIEGLMDNLIDNALRHGGPLDGKPAQVTLALQAATAGEVSRVELSVHDNGPGVSLQQRKLLQERWKRGAADPSLADGHGLGWSIISAYARHLGATLHMADAPGGGLAVSVTLRGCDPFAANKGAT
jgi:two-component system sensor histidine kinase TctE